LIKAVVFLFLWVFVLPVCAQNKMHAPHIEKASKKTRAKISSAPTIAFKWVIKFFQTYISPMDGPRCQLYPTCSGYGKKAFSRNGAVAGFIMSADRLMRDNSGVSKNYQMIKVGDTYYYYDPVKDNEFLFSPKKTL